MVTLAACAETPMRRPRTVLRVLPVLFWLSGASALIFETVFTRLLTYTFGNTAYATSTVLASFLGGLALGAVFLGKWLDRRPASLRTYAVLELLIGSLCLFIPSLFGLLTKLYVVLYHRFQLGPTELTLTRFALAVLLILVPTFLMGGTLPAIARYLAAQRPDFQTQLDRFYAWNTLGGALGVLLSTYIFIPTFGIRGTIALACTANITIFVSIMLSTRKDPATLIPFEIQAHPHILPLTEPMRLKSVSGWLLAGSFLTGAVALSYEVAWTHALSFLIGNTVYAFGLMLFTLLAGLGIGARIVAARLSGPRLWARSLVGSQVLVGVTVFLTLPLWLRVPKAFTNGVMGAYNYDLGALALIVMGRITYIFWTNRGGAARQIRPWYRMYESHIYALVFFVIAVGVLPFLQKYDHTYFVAGELLRFFCVCGLLILPALLIGIGFPLLLNLYTQTSEEVGGRVGRLYALNTLGTVLGSLVTGFILLPRFGSLAVLRACAAANIVLGLIFALALVSMSVRRKWVMSIVAVSGTAACLVVGPRNWDVSRITGTYAYFNSGWVGQKVLFSKEDVQGGLTSVVQNGNLRTLLSNGKFQGDNGGEIGTQTRFAAIPALFTHQFNRALVVGLGTGGTLRAVARFPFKKIDVAELAPEIPDAARQWFLAVNDRVFDRDPRVSLSIADGRNFLLLSQDRYDMITIELTSLWISGEADLYNKEFYELCRQHLGQNGVLQQWVALHHLRTEDMLVVLNTAAQVFPHVAFFAASGHGLLIASSAPLEIDYSQIAGFDEDPGISSDLKSSGLPSAWSLLGEMVLYGSSFRNAISAFPQVTGLPASFASTDFHPYLEYQAPKGITVRYDTVEANMTFLGQFMTTGLAPELQINTLPSDNERSLIFGYVAERQGDRKAAITHYGRVAGTLKVRAQAEIARLTQRVAINQNED